MNQAPFKRAPHSILLVLAGLSVGLQVSSAPPIEEPRVSVTERGSRHLISPDQVPEDLGKSDWASIREAYEAGRHAFQPVAGASGMWRARNPGQAWTTEFDRRGFVARPQAGGWEWGLELKSYGFGEEMVAVMGSAEVTAEGPRLTYAWDDKVEEWFVNDQRGLEHGFTLSERPAVLSATHAQPGPLTFTLAVRGDLRPQVSLDGQGVAFRDGGGATVLTYSGLKVWDADGKILPSTFAREESTVQTVVISVDESGARYPVTIDPIAQQAYLKASNPTSSDFFGESVSVSGDTVVVGAWGEDSSTTGVNSTPNELASFSGAAYVFVRSGSTWTQQAYVKASNTGSGDDFGMSVSVWGDTMVVGAPHEDSSTTGVNSTPNESASTSGAAYVFVRSGSTWTQQAYLKASNTGASDLFGHSVSVSGDTVIVGAYWEDSATTGVNSTPNESAAESGAAYVFVRSGTTWAQQAYLKASNTGASDSFGESVSVSGDTVVVAAALEDSSTTGVNSTPNESASASGAAYVFVRNGPTWTQQAYLKASNSESGDFFGLSVSVWGDTIGVGTPYEDSSTTGVNTAPNESALNSGAAYVFVRSGTTWTQQAYLKASNPGPGDYFGQSISASGDRLVVGAYREDSSTAGVNSTPNESAADSGAAYVFVRGATTWTQHAYLKASNPGMGDDFGVSVSASDDAVVVGASFEASSTTGVNSTPNDSAPGSGAAYVFALNDLTQSSIYSFTASPTLVSPFGSSTLSWAASAGATLTLDGNTVSGPTGQMVVSPGSTSSYTLVATDASGTATRTVTVHVNDGTASLATPTVTAPSAGQTVVVTGVGFAWTAVSGVTGYDLLVVDGSTGSLRFSGSLLGAASTSTLINLPAGSYLLSVRACSGGFAASQCGGYGTQSFMVNPVAPSGAPTVTFPLQGANLTASTQTLSWTAVSPNPALSGLSYELLLKDLTAGTTTLQITVPSSNLSTIFTMKSSSEYELKVRACQADCGPWSAPVTFAVTLPPVPVSAPSGVNCSVSGGNSLTCNWNAVANADAYQIQVVQPPPAGPGGGALTATARQVSATTVTLPVPAGAATVFIAACNGDGCGPNATTPITAAGPNPSQPNIGTPMAGTVVSGPGVLFTWNRIPGDNGSNTSYRLFVQDLSRQATALDVFTTNNFYSAYFKAEGARYDALVIANPGLGSAVTGPAQGFNVAGASATAPTMVSPPHNGSVSAGNIQLGWSPVPGATLYEYFVAVLGQGNATARGVTPGLLTQVPLTGSGAGTVYSGIVRACPASAVCVSGSGAGWGPWSNAPGGPGVTNFTVVP